MSYDWLCSGAVAWSCVCACVCLFAEEEMPGHNLDTSGFSVCPVLLDLKFSMIIHKSKPIFDNIYGRHFFCNSHSIHLKPVIISLDCCFHWLFTDNSDAVSCLLY